MRRLRVINERFFLLLVNFALPPARLIFANIDCRWAKTLDESSTASVAEKAVSALVAEGIFVREATPVKSSLEELFGELTGVRVSKEVLDDPQADGGGDDGAKDEDKDEEEEAS